MGKLTQRQQKIVDQFNALAEAHPDKSTAWLLQVTADATRCDYSDVVRALGDDAEANGRVQPSGDER